MTPNCSDPVKTLASCRVSKCISSLITIETWGRGLSYLSWNCCLTVVAKWNNLEHSFLKLNTTLCFLAFAMQMDEHTVGYLTWRAGLSSAMVTTIAHNRENYRVEGSISLGIPHSFISFNYSYNFAQLKLKMSTALKSVKICLNIFIG